MSPRLCLVLEGASLHVTEVEQWPFARHWEWMEIPILRRDIEGFLAVYKRWLASDPNARWYAKTEEYVARLFTAAVAGDPEATALFLAMREDAGLDGAAAEAYSDARATYECQCQRARFENTAVLHSRMRNRSVYC